MSVYDPSKHREGPDFSSLPAREEIPLHLVEPLVVPDIGGAALEWVQGEGLVELAELSQPIRICKSPAEALARAAVRFRDATVAMELITGSHEPSTIHILAGHRLPFVQQALAEALRAHSDYMVRSLQQGSYGCLYTPGAHGTGREVDVAIVYARPDETEEELMTPSACLGFTRIPRVYPKTRDPINRPVSFFARVDAAHDLLRLCMQKEGFQHPQGTPDWHYSYIGKPPVVQG